MCKCAGVLCYPRCDTSASCVSKRASVPCFCDRYFAESLLSRSSRLGWSLAMGFAKVAVEKRCVQYTGFIPFLIYVYVGCPLTDVLFTPGTRDSFLSVFTFTLGGHCGWFVLHPNHGTHSFPIWSQGKQRIVDVLQTVLLFVFGLQYSPTRGLYRFFTLHRTHHFLVLGETKRCINRIVNSAYASIL